MLSFNFENRAAPPLNLADLITTSVKLAIQASVDIKQIFEDGELRTVDKGQQNRQVLTGADEKKIEDPQTMVRIFSDI